MHRQALLRASSLTSRAAGRATRSSNAMRPVFRAATTTCHHSSMPASSSVRPFSASPSRRKGLMPDTENPEKKPSEAREVAYAPLELTESEYHELADTWMENILGRFEELQDRREDIDVEYSAGVLTINFPPKGTYVLNKQPPNKQIWLSSPITGPKRYDWCLVGEGQNDKEGTGEGNWIYARDGSSLNELILEELDVDLGSEVAE